jgi:hypothetical protein
MRDHRRAGVDQGSQPTGMVEMMMGIDDEPYRLVRDRSPPTLLMTASALASSERLDQHDVIGHFDRHAVMRPAPQDNTPSAIFCTSTWAASVWRPGASRESWRRPERSARRS